jgi:Zn-dependent protease
MIQLFSIVILIFSTAIHEYMHAWMADQQGDTTAKDEGRLTLNPIKHVDVFGSILLPLLLVLTHSDIILGWAKPVPFNPYNLRDQKYGPAKVALAGPMANLIMALFFGLILRFFSLQLYAINTVLVTLFSTIVFVNLLLMVFNLIPLPPMDGSKVLMPFLPYSWRVRFMQIEGLGTVFVFFLVIIGFSAFIWPITNFLYNLIVG